MKQRLWKRMIAMILSLLIVIGGLPMQPMSVIAASELAGESYKSDSDQKPDGFEQEYESVQEEGREEETEVEGDLDLSVNTVADEAEYDSEIAQIEEESTEPSVGNAVGSLVVGENDLVIYEDDCTVYSFIPSESGYYHFYSERGSDPVAVLYSGYTQIAYDDNGGNHYNFSMYATLEEGNEYTLEVMSNDGWDNLAVWVEKTTAYQITVECNSEHGTIDLDKDYATLGETVLFNYSSEDGYCLSNLTVNDSVGNELSVNWTYYKGYSFDMAQGDVVISAEFASNNLVLGNNTLLLTNHNGGWEEYEFSPEESGIYTFDWDGGDLPSTALYDGDKRIALEDYDWSEGNYSSEFSAELMAGKTYAFKISNNDWQGAFEIENVTVSKSPAHEIFLDDALEHGKITASRHYVLIGDSVVLSAECEKGYYLKRWIVSDADGNEVESEVYDSRIFSCPDSDVTVSAEIAEKPKIQIGENILPKSYSGQEWEEYHFIPTEAGYYSFYSEVDKEPERIYLMDGDIKIAYGSQIYVDLEADKDYVLRAHSSYYYVEDSFSVLVKKITKHKIMIGNDVENGIIEASHTGAGEGESISLKATAGTGYYLQHWNVIDEDGKEVPVIKNSFVMPESDVTVSAAFAERPKRLQVGENILPIQYEEELSYEFIPEKSGLYRFTDNNNVITGSGDIGVYLYKGDETIRRDYSETGFLFSAELNAEESYTLVLEDHKGSATNMTVSVDLLDVWSITVNDVEHGTIEVPEEGREDDKIELNAYPERGYHICWVVKREDGQDIPLSEANRYDYWGDYPEEKYQYFMMPKGNVNVSAEFVKNDPIHIGINLLKIENTSSAGGTEYTFSPTQSGVYLFYSLGDKRPIVQIYDGGTQIKYAGSRSYGFLDDSEDNVFFAVVLEADKEYTIKVSQTYFEDFELCVEYGISSIVLGENVVSTSVGKSTVYEFTPNKDGGYYFYSDDESMRIDLEDASNWSASGTRIESSEIKKMLEAGKTYFLYVKGTEGQKVNFKLRIEEMPTYKIVVDDQLEHGYIEASYDLAWEGREIRLYDYLGRNYYVSRWIVTDEAGKEVEVTDGYFTMPKRNVFVSAEIEKNPELHAGENIITQEEKSRVWYVFSPAENGDYCFYSVGSGDPSANLYDGDEWLYGNDDVGEERNFSFTASNLEKDKEYAISFYLYRRGDSSTYSVWVKSLTMHNIAADENIENGIIMASASEAGAGDIVQLDVRPDEGFLVKNVCVNGEAIDPVDGAYSFVMPAEDVEITAEFEDSRNFINASNVTLGGELGLNFYLVVPDSVANAGAKAVLDGPYGEREFVLKDLTKDEKGRYKVTYKVTAIKVDQPISVKVVDADGNTLALSYKDGTAVENDVFVSGIYDYVERAKEDETITESAKTIINAMYTYGAYSVKWKYGTDVPDDVDVLPVITKDSMAGYAPRRKGKSDSLKDMTMTLLLDSNTAMRVYFKSEDGIANHVVKYGDSELKIRKKSKGKYYVMIDDIGARNLKKEYTVTFDDSSTMTFSAISYAYIFLYSGIDDEGTLNVLRALYAYSNAVEAALG